MTEQNRRRPRIVTSRTIAVVVLCLVSVVMISDFRSLFRPQFTILHWQFVALPFLPTAVETTANIALYGYLLYLLVIVERAIERMDERVLWFCLIGGPLLHPLRVLWTVIGTPGNYIRCLAALFAWLAAISLCLYNWKCAGNASAPVVRDNRELKTDD